MDILGVYIPIKYMVFSSINILAFIILFLMNLSNRTKLRKLRQKYNNFMNGFGDKNIEELLEEHIKIVNQVAEKNREIENHLNNIDRNLLQCTQKMGVVRYNAFDNVGSDLSFAIAMLDNNDNGVVISGIYARDSSSTYAKPIAGGKSRYPLSAEELQALEIARKSHREVMYSDNKKSF